MPRIPSSAVQRASLLKPMRYRRSYVAWRIGPLGPSVAAVHGNPSPVMRVVASCGLLLELSEARGVLTPPTPPPRGRRKKSSH
jgi:hypothetical protein